MSQQTLQEALKTRKEGIEDQVKRLTQLIEDLIEMKNVMKKQGVSVTDCDNFLKRIGGEAACTANTFVEFNNSIKNQPTEGAIGTCIKVIAYLEGFPLENQQYSDYMEFLLNLRKNISSHNPKPQTVDELDQMILREKHWDKFPTSKHCSKCSREFDHYYEDELCRICLKPICINCKNTKRFGQLDVTICKTCSHLKSLQQREVKVEKVVERILNDTSAFFEKIKGSGSNNTGNLQFYQEVEGSKSSNAKYYLFIASGVTTVTIAAIAAIGLAMLTGVGIPFAPAIGGGGAVVTQSLTAAAAASTAGSTTVGAVLLSGGGAVTVAASTVAAIIVSKAKQKSNNDSSGKELDEEDGDEDDVDEDEMNAFIDKRLNEFLKEKHQNDEDDDDDDDEIDVNFNSD
jgi:ribosomal protein S14